MGAAQEGHTPVVRLLLDVKADATDDDQGPRTALMLAERDKQPAPPELRRLTRRDARGRRRLV